jgi:dTDP-4-dehydrorhamnose 3,5-epimerase
MKIIATSIPGLLVIEPQVFEDARGYFFESYNEKTFRSAGITCYFVQDNQSKSNKGVLRGLHYQLEPFSQAKLVRVISGSVFDVAVDIRKGSPTFGQWFGTVLSAENKKQMFIPRGFAHGFLVLEDNTEFFYKCDNFYSREHDRAIKFDDPAIGIEWNISPTDLILSDKDKNAPLLKDAEYNFVFQTYS